MSRHLVTIRSTADKIRAAEYLSQAPFGTRVEFRAAKRTLPQNDRMWAMLTDVSRQKQHHGRKYTPDQWKCIFMNALGREIEIVPTLDGSSIMPLGYRSSELSKGEMSDLIELMMSWGAQNGVIFQDDLRMAG